jgi:outer membrane protein assembly factor BamB
MLIVMQKLPAALLAAAVVLWGACSDGMGPGGGDSVVWKVPSGAPTDGLPFVPAANANRSMIYFATPDTRLKKVRASDGHVMWDVSAGVVRPVFPRWNAVVSANVVALSKVDIVAFDTTTGASRWTYVPADGEETGDAPLAANDSTIFAAGRKGHVHAVNAKTGMARWITNVSEGKPNVATFNPTLSVDIVFVCSKDFDANPASGAVWALEATTGAVKWSYHFVADVAGQATSCLGSAAVWHDFVIQPEEGGRVFAFDRATGQVQWTAPRVTQFLSDTRWAAVGGDVVLVTSQTGSGMIVAYEAATGVEKWRRTEWSGSIFVPVLDSTVAYVDHGWVFASYDLATGATRWQTPQSFNGPETVYKGGPIIAGSRIYVAGRNGSYALRR